MPIWTCAGLALKLTFVLWCCQQNSDNVGKAASRVTIVVVSKARGFGGFSSEVPRLQLMVKGHFFNLDGNRINDDVLARFLKTSDSNKNVPFRIQITVENSEETSVLTLQAAIERIVGAFDDTRTIVIGIELRASKK